MCSKFRQYNIIAIFVFDGKADINKTECLQERKKNVINIKKNMIY